MSNALWAIAGFCLGAYVLARVVTVAQKRREPTFQNDWTDYTVSMFDERKRFQQHLRDNIFENWRQ